MWGDPPVQAVSHLGNMKCKLFTEAIDRSALFETQGVEALLKDFTLAWFKGQYRSYIEA